MVDVCMTEEEPLVRSTVIYMPYDARRFSRRVSMSLESGYLNMMFCPCNQASSGFLKCGYVCYQYSESTGFKEFFRLLGRMNHLERHTIMFDCFVIILEIILTLPV